MKALGIDFETNGFDPKTCYITEVGFVVFDSGWIVDEKYSSLVYIPAALPLSAEIVEVTGITDEMLKKEGAPIEVVLNRITTAAFGCGVVIAHNAQFDKAFLDEAFLRQGITDSIAQSLPWLCSMNDVDHKGKKCRKLSHLAVDAGLTVDGSALHRALDDVLLMGEMLDAIGASPEAMLAYKNEPWIYMQAQTSKPWEDGGKSNELAKADGYSWEKIPGDTNVFPKSWVKRVKAGKLDEEKARPVGFARIRIEPK